MAQLSATSNQWSAEEQEGGHSGICTMGMTLFEKGVL